MTNTPLVIDTGGTIDITPTWLGILPVLFAALEGGTPTGKRIAREELTRMARLADLYVASCPPEADEYEGEDEPHTGFFIVKRADYWEVRDSGNLNRVVETYSDRAAAQGHADRQNALHSI